MDCRVELDNDEGAALLATGPSAGLIMRGLDPRNHAALIDAAVMPED